MFLFLILFNLSLLSRKTQEGLKHTNYISHKESFVSHVHLYKYLYVSLQENPKVAVIRTQ